MFVIVLIIIFSFLLPAACLPAPLCSSCLPSPSYSRMSLTRSPNGKSSSYVTLKKCVCNLAELYVEWHPDVLKVIQHEYDLCYMSEQDLSTTFLFPPFLSFPFLGCHSTSRPADGSISSPNHSSTGPLFVTPEHGEELWCVCSPTLP